MNKDPVIWSVSAQSDKNFAKTINTLIESIKTTSIEKYSNKTKPLYETWNKTN